MSIMDNLVDLAYSRLYGYTLSEQGDIFLKNKIVDSPISEYRVNQLKSFLITLNEHPELTIDDYENNSELISISTYLKNLLAQITFRIIPKKGSESINSIEILKLLINSKKNIKLEFPEIKFFIDMPIELYIIDMLWVMKAGVHIDTNISDCCYWYRISKNNIENPHLYTTDKTYSEQYLLWQNNGLKIADALIAEKKWNIAFLFIDLFKCFYNIQIDFKESSYLFNRLSVISQEETKFIQRLTEIIEKIHLSYFNYSKDVFSFLKYCDINTISLPIGPLSSNILSSWYLQKIDIEITRKIKPSYYGRYVDDIFMIIKEPRTLNNNQKAEQFINSYFVSKGILKHVNNEYEFILDNKLKIQKRKINLYYLEIINQTNKINEIKSKINEFYTPSGCSEDFNWVENMNSIRYKILQNNKKDFSCNVDEIIKSQNNRNHATKILNDVIKKFGFNSLSNIKLTKAILLDSFQGKPNAEMKVLISSIEEKIPEKLLSANFNNQLKVADTLLTQQLIEFGYRDDLARWAISTWISALDIKNNN